MATGRVKRQPQRRCIVCQTARAKRDLVRIVRKPTGEVEIDPTGKLAGRGAYLCRRQRCWTAALARKRIQAALTVELSAEDTARLAEFASQLPEDLAEPEASGSA